MSKQLDGREIFVDGSNGNLESQSKEKGQEERIWEILKANRFKKTKKLIRNVNITFANISSFDIFISYSFYIICKLPRFTALLERAN